MDLPAGGKNCSRRDAEMKCFTDVDYFSWQPETLHVFIYAFKTEPFLCFKSSGIVIKATSCHIEAGSNSKLKGKPQQVKVCVGFHLTVSPIKSEGAVDRICRVLLSLLSSPWWFIDDLWVAGALPTLLITQISCLECLCRFFGDTMLWPLVPIHWVRLGHALVFHAFVFPPSPS